MNISNTAWLQEDENIEEVHDESGIDYDEGEVTDLECLNCFVGTIYRFTESNGPDDFRSVLICKNCGEREDE